MIYASMVNQILSSRSTQMWRRSYVVWNGWWNLSSSRNVRGRRRVSRHNIARLGPYIDLYVLCSIIFLKWVHPCFTATLCRVERMKETQKTERSENDFDIQPTCVHLRDCVPTTCAVRLSRIPKCQHRKNWSQRFLPWFIIYKDKSRCWFYSFWA